MFLLGPVLPCHQIHDVRPKPHRLGTALPATFAVKNWNPHDLYNGSKPGTPPTTLKSGYTITTVGDTSNYTYVYDGIDHYYYLEGPDMTVTIEDGQTMGYMLPTYYVAMPASGQIEVSDSVLASPHAVGLVRRDLRTHRLAGRSSPPTVRAPGGLGVHRTEAPQGQRYADRQDQHAPRNHGRDRMI